MPKIVLNPLTGELDFVTGLLPELNDVKDTVTSTKGSLLVGDGTEYDEFAVGTNGLVLTADSTQPLGVSWAASGSGDVSGPASSTDNAIVRFDGTTGKLIQNSGVTIDDSDNITTPGNLTVNGNASLGDNSGDTINLGGGTSDTVNLNSDLTVGTGLVGIGSSTTDYLTDLWLEAADDLGPDNDAYNLNATGTDAGSYAVGADPSILDNSSSTNVMSVLDDLDAAITAAGSGTASTTYIINTDATGAVDEDSCLIVKGGDGAGSIISSRFCQDSSAQKIQVYTDDDGTQVSPTFSIGDQNTSVANLDATLELASTNSAAGVIVGSVGWSVTGADTHGDFLFGGAGLTTGSFVGPATDNVIDLGASGNRFKDAYFSGTTTTGVAEFPESPGDPGAVTNAGSVYTKDDSGDTELYFQDAAGNVVQITEDGYLKGTVLSFTAAEALNAGDLISLNTSGQARKANSTYSQDRFRVVGVAIGSALLGGVVNTYLEGSLAPVRFGSAPAASSNGEYVFLNNVDGQATLTPPSAGGQVRFGVGVLQGADGISVTPDVVISPRYISRRP